MSHRTHRLRAAASLALLLAGILAVLLSQPTIAAPRATARPATVLHVPADYTTIQAAIDAAQPGDEVRVLMTDVDTDPEYFGEHLDISETLTLSGGWNAGFTKIVGRTYLLPNWDGGLGRGITIQSTDPITVTIRRFIVMGGNATGLGCGSAALPFLRADDSWAADQFPPPVARGSAARAPVAPALTEQPDAGLADWMAGLVGLADRGLYPGGHPSLERVQERVARLASAATADTGSADAGPALAASAASPADEATDCGGGLYAESANLVVEDAAFQKNLASNTGDGAGGGLFIQGGSLIVENSSFAANVASQTGYGVGGGLLVTGVPAGGQVVLRQDTFYRNTAAGLRGLGGGIRLDGLVLGAPPAVVSIEDCEFRENIAGMDKGPGGISSYGGGIYMTDDQMTNALVAGNAFTANVACGDCQAYGGGLAVYGAFGGHTQPSAITVTGNSLVDNAASLAGDGTGGGIYLYNLNDTLVQGNRLAGNQASATGSGDGGGLALSPCFRAAAQVSSANVRIDGNIITDNRATGYAGGLLAWGPDRTVVANNVIAGNHAPRAGGLAFYGAAPEVPAPQGTVVNNTVAGNDAEGILLSKWISSTVRLTNNIVVSHTLGVAAPDNSLADIRYTLWHGNGVDLTPALTQTDSLSAAPGFVDPANDDFHIRPASPACDAGDPAGVPPAPPVDIEGTLRPFGPRVDLGAYEWHGPRTWLPVVIR
jgi:hypothetical protein